jgi:hypothetical protein
VFSTYVYPTVCFGTHRDVLCFGIDCMGGELIYSSAQFFSNLQNTFIPAGWQCTARSDNAAMEYKNLKENPCCLLHSSVEA